MGKRRRHSWGAGRPGIVPTTRDGQAIHEAMAAAGVKGSYKDFVLLVGSRLIDRSGAVDVTLLPDAPTSGASIEIIHKRDLRRFIGDQALQYWNPRLGRVPPRRK